MLVLVCYDVSTKDKPGVRRLAHVAKACKDYGQRVQNSVFECEVDPGKWQELRGRLLKIFDDEQDSLRFYFLGSGEGKRRRVEHHGTKAVPDLSEDALIV